MRPFTGRTDTPEEPLVEHDELVAVLQAGHADDASGRARTRAVECLDRWLQRGYEPPSRVADEARIIAAGGWLLNHRPDHPVIPVWAARAPLVLSDLEDKPLAALLANFSFEHSIRIGDFSEAGRLVAEMWERTESNDQARLTWLPSAALYLWLSGRAEAAMSTLQPALDASDLPPSLHYALLEQAASAALSCGDAQSCLQFLARAADLDVVLAAHERAHGWFLRAGVAVVREQQTEASEAIARCEECARLVDARFFKALWRLGGSVVRLKTGHARRAERELSDLLGDVVLMRARYLEWSVRLARAAARRALERHLAAEGDLIAALRIAGQNGYVNCDPWGMNASMLALLQSAVERGIEVRAARGILAQHTG